MLKKTSGSFPIRHCEASRIEGGGVGSERIVGASNADKWNVNMLKHVKNLEFHSWEPIWRACLKLFIFETPLTKIDIGSLLDS